MAWQWTNQTNGRWYEARIEKVLLGTGLAIVTRWGGGDRAGVAHRQYPVETRAEARKLLHDLCMRRRRRGYERAANTQTFEPRQQQIDQPKRVVEGWN
jgi:predicted DNA-binding WGR domain protein